MKIYEIAAPELMSEGMVEPNTLLSIRNVVKRGKATNTFEFVVITRLLQMLKNGTFYSETNPLEVNLTTSKELIDALRAMEPAQLAKIAGMLLGMLEAKDVDAFGRYCCPEMGYVDWINLFRSREATESLGSGDPGKQQVYLSKTQSGRTGFFTNRTLAVPLEPNEYEELLRDKAKAKAKAERLGFEFIDTP